MGMTIFDTPVLTPLARFLGWLFLKIAGWEKEGDVPDAPKFILIGAPHTSNWDVPFVLSLAFALRVKVFWLMKDSLFRWPFGGFFRWLGGIPVDRSKRKGVVAQIDGTETQIGSRRMMEEAGISTSAVDAITEELENQGKTVMLIAADSELQGLIAVADTLKEDSAQAIAELQRLGVKTAMITGDNQRTANAIANSVNIDHVVAEVLPDGKVAEVKRLQDQFGMVAFVGDGINDAPALTQADVGIAIGTGTDIAIEASDVTLVRGELTGVVEAINLSRATFRKIQQNLFWAFFYNVIMVPLAVAGWMHPVLAEVAMATSSITVVTNANLLRRIEIRPEYAREK